jgi:hypothetical protein
LPKVHVLILQPLHGFPIIKVKSASPRICVSLTAQGFFRGQSGPVDLRLTVKESIQSCTWELVAKISSWKANDQANGRENDTRMTTWARQTLPPWYINADRLSDFTFEITRATESVLDCDGDSADEQSSSNASWHEGKNIEECDAMCFLNIIADPILTCKIANCCSFNSHL